MGRKSKYTTYGKLEYVHRCIKGDDSVNHAAKLIGVSYTTLERWIRNFESLGVDGLNNTSKNRVYSEEVKNMESNQINSCETG